MEVEMEPTSPERGGAPAGGVPTATAPDDTTRINRTDRSVCCCKFCFNFVVSGRECKRINRHSQNRTEQCQGRKIARCARVCKSSSLTIVS